MARIARVQVLPQPRDGYECPWLFNALTPGLSWLGLTLYQIQGQVRVHLSRLPQPLFTLATL